MIKEKIDKFIEIQNLVNKIYYMLDYYSIFENSGLSEDDFKKYIFQQLHRVHYVETLAKFLENKIKKIRKNIDLYLNLKDLIDSLNYLKQYLD